MEGLRREMADHRWHDRDMSSGEIQRRDHDKNRRMIKIWKSALIRNARTGVACTPKSAVSKNLFAANEMRSSIVICE